MENDPKKREDNLRANLQQFNLLDREVIAAFDFGSIQRGQPRTLNKGKPLSLAAVCANHRLHRDPTGPVTPGDCIYIFEPGVAITFDTKLGEISGDGIFSRYCQSDVTFREFVGWVLATDGGVERIHPFHLDYEVACLEQALAQAPFDADEATMEEYFFKGGFHRLWMELMYQRKGSRFDGTGTYADAWRIATRTVRGVQHNGYQFFS